MARSQYIYLISDCYERPERVFTVKHEARAWIRRQEPGFVSWVHHFRDGGERIQTVTVEEFMIHG
jgi:hypothetical protein